MNLVRSVLPDAYAAKARGFVLSAIALGAVYAYYLAVDADDAIPPAAAEVIPMPPTVRAASITSPIYIIPEATAQETPGPAAPPRAKIARDLQTAPAKARCYDGPLTGRWSAASQAAMSAFLSTVNAHLPVEDPDEALLALISSNSEASCAAHPMLVADAQDTRAAASYDAASAQTKVAIATDAPPASQTSGSVAATPSSSDDRSMLDHPWAQPEMLVPPVAMTPPTPAASSISTSRVERADRDAGQNASPTSAVSAAEPPSAAAVMKVRTAANDPRGLRFEGGRVVSDEKPEFVPDPRTAASQPAPLSEATAESAPAKVAQRKTKPAKRRTTRSNDSGFGVSFDSIQRSFSSLFD